VIERLYLRNEWKFAGVLPQADRALAVAWWTLLLVRGLLPALFAIAMGGLVGAVERGGGLAAPLGVVGVVFVLLQVLSPMRTTPSAPISGAVPQRGCTTGSPSRASGRRAWVISRTRS